MNTNSRVEKTSINALYSIISRCIVFILTFVSRRFFIQYIGIEYLGIDGLFSNILNVLSLADLGLGTAMSYSFYKPLKDNDTQKLAALITFYKKMYYIIATVVAVVGCLFIPLLKYIVNTDREIPYLTFYYIIVLSNTVISYLWVYKSTIIGADQKGYIVTKYNTIINVIKTAIQLLIIIVFKNFVIYILSGVFFTLFNNLYISYIADKMYPYIRHKQPLDKSEKKEIFSNIYSMFIYKIAYTLFGGIDSIIISVLVGTVMVGYYSNYNMLIYWITQVISLGLNAVIPSVGNLLAGKDSKKNLNVFLTIQMICFIAYANISVLFFNTSNEIISIWLDKKLVLDTITVAAISLDRFLDGGLRALTIYRDASGLYLKTKYSIMIAAILNVFLSIVFGKLFGLAGIIFATICSRFVYLLYDPIVLYKVYFNQSSIDFYKEYLINIFIVIGLSCLIKYIFTFININTWCSIVLKLLFGMLIINITYFFLYRKKDSFIYLKDKLYFLFSKLAKNIKKV